MTSNDDDLRRQRIRAVIRDFFRDKPPGTSIEQHELAPVMTKIYLDHSDGRYFTRQLTDEEVAQHDAVDVAHVEDAVWAEYLKHCGNDGIWQALWRAISNDQYTRRRERELMPLEDAEREIRRLSHDLDQARRMWKHYERESHDLRGKQHRAGFTEFTCIYPIPGCDVNVLSRAEWRDRAAEILEDYNVDHAAEGMKIQGCCCGNTHIKIDDAGTEVLRAAGFLVEHDAESDSID